jgi:negative regulator of flagellin synthesis FlgM
LSYTNGITNAQQGFDAVEAAVTASTNRAAKTEQSSAALVSGSVQAGSSSASAVDQASLSTTSGVMAQALTASDDVRTEKVAALQQSIAAGTYNVSSSDVADKLINALLQ